MMRSWPLRRKSSQQSLSTQEPSESHTRHSIPTALLRQRPQSLVSISGSDSAPSEADVYSTSSSPRNKSASSYLNVAQQKDQKHRKKVASAFSNKGKDESRKRVNSLPSLLKTPKSASASLSITSAQSEMQDPSKSDEENHDAGAYLDSGTTGLHSPASGEEDVLPRASQSSQRGKDRHDDIGSSTQSALQALQHLHGAAQLDRDTGQTDQLTDLEGTPSAVDDSQATPNNATEHQHHDWPYKVRNKQTLLEFGPFPEEYMRCRWELQAVSERSAGPSSCSLIAMPVPSLLHCNDAVYWATVRAACVASCVTSIVNEASTLLSHYKESRWSS